jgi:hypothetical protein
MGCIQAEVKIFPGKFVQIPNQNPTKSGLGRGRFSGHKLKGRKAENSTASDISAAL